MYLTTAALQAKITVAGSSPCPKVVAGKVGSPGKDIQPHRATSN